MPLQLPQLSFVISCDEREMETYDVKREGSSLITAFVASEAGKQFSITYKNKLLDIDLVVFLHIDGEVVRRSYLSAQEDRCMIGIYKNPSAILPFKFQELELVDPDMEDAPVVPEMGTIEAQVFRARRLRSAEHNPPVMKHGLHGSRVSERSKKAGWHHVSTADEVPFDSSRRHTVAADYIDPPNAPCATFKVFYRPKELLMAQGVIPGPDVAAGTSGVVNDRKRNREDEMPGPSKRHTGPTIKQEMSTITRSQRIEDLQAELNSLMAERTSSSVKRELRSPSPIVVGKAAGEVVDLTLDD